ncbi:MAG TPA: type II secretion system protein GspJ [Kofleriaceae bacterium]|nr:type II secretion system protein GspJ [Kofleriaceae bacterium]
MTRRRSEQSGFTLIEVVVSVAVLSLMMSMAWYTITVTARSKEQVEDLQLRNHEIRVAMAQMVKDVESAYLSSNEDQNQQERRTLFVGKSQGPVDDLRFSSLGHRVLWADANESEQTQIAYSSASDRKDAGKRNLIRRELRRLSNEPWKNEPASVDVLLRGIQKVSFEYFDWTSEEWRDSWDSTKVDGQRGRLPYRVRIHLEVEGYTGETLKFTSTARISMQQELKFFAN